MRINDRLLSAVVFLGLEGHSGFTPLGTGFLAVKSTDGRLFQHVVTARHVVEQAGNNDVCIRLNTLDGGRLEHTRTAMDAWVYHPDPMVDVAVCPTHVPPEHYDICHLSMDQDVLTPELIEQYQFGVGDDVFMVGMFTRHLGDARNVPIVRTGTIAAMPAEKVETDRGPVHAFLVEARSIAGLSGSPVFLHVAPLRVLPRGDVSAAQGKTHYFLGLMQGHHVTQDPVDVASPDLSTPGDMNTGIGVVIPAERVLEVIDLPQLRDERREIAERMRQKS